MPLLDAVSTALANALGVDAAVGGYVLGTLILAAGILAIALLMRDVPLMPMAIMSGVMISTVILLELWPIWTLIFIVLLLAAAIVFGGRETGRAVA